MVTITVRIPFATSDLAGCLDLRDAVDRKAGEDGELGLVRHEEAHVADAREIEIGHGGRGIEERLDAEPLCPGDGVVDRLERHFELEKDQRAGLEVVGRPVDVGRRQRRRSPP